MPPRKDGPVGPHRREAFRPGYDHKCESRRWDSGQELGLDLDAPTHVGLLFARSRKGRTPVALNCLQAGQIPFWPIGPLALNCWPLGPLPTHPRSAGPPPPFLRTTRARLALVASHSHPTSSVAGSQPQGSLSATDYKSCRRDGVRVYVGVLSYCILAARPWACMRPFTHMGSEMSIPFLLGAGPPASGGQTSGPTNFNHVSSLVSTLSVVKYPRRCSGSKVLDDL